MKGRGFLFLLIFIYSSTILLPIQEKSILQKKLNEKEAVIWYLGHCGYAVKTKSKLLIFDYQENVQTPDRKKVNPPSYPSIFNGWINPEELKDMDVAVFVSHSHSDHFDKRIFEWEKKIKKINYFFGWQEKEGGIYHSMPAQRKIARFDGLEVYTVNSHHSGVPESAFLVKVDGLTIFHQGDYIGQMEESGPYHVKEDMEYLRTKFIKADLMFIHSVAYEQMDQIAKGINAAAAFPTHYGYREYKYKEFESDFKKWELNSALFCPAKKGDYFEYKNGAIVK